jgi:hypothetical protein
MSDNPTPEIEPEPNVVEGKLTEELGSLGRNLIGVLRAAWERPERQKLQQEIEGGLTDLGNTLRKEAKAVSDNTVTQRVKSEVEDLGSRVRSGQVEAKVRDELIGALHIVNTELSKVADILASSGKEAAQSEAETIVEVETSVETAEAVQMPSMPAEVLSDAAGAGIDEATVDAPPPEDHAPSEEA